jgi:hypothetical protein
VGNIQLIGEADQKSQIPRSKSQGTSKSQTSKGADYKVFFGCWCLGFPWSLGFGISARRRAWKIQPPNYVDTLQFLTTSQRSSNFEAPNSVAARVRLVIGAWGFVGAWDLGFGISAKRRAWKIQPSNYVDTLQFLRTLSPPHEMAFPFIARCRDLWRGGILQLRPLR